MKLVSYLAISAFVFLTLMCGPTPPGTPTPTPTPPPTPTPAPHAVSIEKELMITDLAVVNSPEATSPDGAFAIKSLLTNMAPPGKTAKDVMLSLLNTWKTPQPVNSFSVPIRPRVVSDVIEAWKTKDGQPGVDDAQWNMNFANAPFRLLAIVNRIDLADRDNSGNVFNAGEGRFVFGILDSAGKPLQFTIIFEYEQKAANQAELEQWARDWHNLGSFPSFDANYINALKAVTAKFAGQGVMPAKPNGSAINQVRTNEFLNSPWELRELRLNAASGLLKQEPTRQTPHDSFNNTARLTDFITQHQGDILADNHEVPLSFPESPPQPFLGSNPQVTAGFWRTPSAVDPEARHKFSLLTCNACHGRETGTQFLHVSPRAANQKSELSGFLKGVSNVPDPTGNGQTRPFNDLEGRVGVMNALIGQAPMAIAEDVFANRAKRVH